MLIILLAIRHIPLHFDFISLRGKEMSLLLHQKENKNVSISFHWRKTYILFPFQIKMREGEKKSLPLHPLFITGGRGGGSEEVSSYAVYTLKSHDQ